MKRSLVWFTTDLRLTDNETLWQATRRGGEVIPVYCFDEAMLKPTRFGYRKTGVFRMKFLLESLINLDQNLRSMGSGLLFVKGKAEEQIPQLVKEYGVSVVFTKKQVGSEELNTQQNVEKKLVQIQCSLDLVSTSTLYRAEDLPFSVKDIPDIFTKFRLKAEKESLVRSPLPRPEKIASPLIPPPDLPTLNQLGYQEMKSHPAATLKFEGGETAAWKRLHYYFFESHLLSVYKETRNELLGADYSSKFSPWLALGCLSARSIYAQVKEYEKQVESNDSTYWLVFELLWRDYFRFMMKKHRNAYFLPEGISSLAPTVNYTPHVMNAWQNGQTGVDFIDANMRELNHTGFMSNRGRQNVASFLCYHLKQDWRYGAAYFEQQLIDYDVSSNWGNWAYLAGVGNDPRHRQFNVEKQAEQYDKQLTYRKAWLTTL